MCSNINWTFSFCQYAPQSIWKLRSETLAWIFSFNLIRPYCGLYCFDTWYKHLLSLWSKNFWSDKNCKCKNKERFLVPGSRCPRCLIRFPGSKDITSSYPKCQMHVTADIYLVEELNPSCSISTEAANTSGLCQCKVNLKDTKYWWANYSSCRAVVNHP